MAAAQRPNNAAPITPEDVGLLLHEWTEAQEMEKDVPYRTAHATANKVYNWQQKTGQPTGTRTGVYGAGLTAEAARAGHSGPAKVDNRSSPAAALRLARWTAVDQEVGQGQDRRGAGREGGT